MPTKRWFSSRLIWVNIIAVVAMVVQLFSADIATEIVAAEASIIGVVNLILRLVTHEGLTK